MRLLITSFLVLFLCAAPSYGNQVAIVIDDIGYHERDLELLDLPGQLSYAVLPHTPFSQRFAYQASHKRRELLLHIPMQALEDKALGPGALTLDMRKWQLQTTLGHALATLPQVKGVNNHMGSALTQYVEPMKWTMELLKKRGLYFLDSRTTELSQAQHVANLYGVANVARHVFLDNQTHPDALRKQFDQLKTIAHQQGYAIGIAHPYPQTRAFLTTALDELATEGIELVPLSQLVEQKYIQLAAIKSPPQSSE